MLENAEDLDRVMPMYNLLEYSHKYSITSGSLWNYYRDEIDDVDINGSASDGKSFEYKSKIVGEKPERSLQLRNLGDAYQPAHLPVPFLNDKRLYVDRTS